MQKHLIVLIVLLVPASIRGQDVQFLEFPEFTFDSGAVVPNVKLAYTTRGVLNESKSNVILLPSDYGADHCGYDYLIGPGRALDPSKYFLVLTNMFANGVSSSPNNTPAPFDGPRFPSVSIRDNVAAQRHLIGTVLGISKLKAVVGFSLGGQQAYQWAVSYPEMMESIVVICGNAKQYPFGIVRLQGAISALKADSEFRGGYYTRPPENGLRAMAMHYQGWSRSPAAFPRDLLDDSSDDESELLLESSSNTFLSADANNLLSQAETWKRHDVGDSSREFDGRVERALQSIKAKVLLLPTTTDQYFPLLDAEFESQFIPRVTLIPIQTDFGHAGGGGTDPRATAAIDLAIRDFLNPPDSSHPVSNGLPVNAATTKGIARRSKLDIYEAKLLDDQGAMHSLEEFSGSPHVVVLIRGAFCKLCMSQLLEFHQRLGTKKFPIVVITPVNDLAQLKDIPFHVYCDPDLYLFKNLDTFITEPLHGTFVFGSDDEILLQEIGEEPFTDFAAVEAAIGRAALSKGDR